MSEPSSGGHHAKQQHEWHESEHERLEGTRGELRALLEAGQAGGLDDVATWQSAIRTALGDLRASLASHFEHEEASDGLYGDEFESSFPRFVHALAKLRAQHAEMLERLSSEAGTEVSDVAGAEALCREVQSTVDMLGQHEHRENEILQEAYTRDLSAGD